ncbi:MAG: ribosome silencing factor [Myxococcaceae bacterium]
MAAKKKITKKSPAKKPTKSSAKKSSAKKSAPKKSTGSRKTASRKAPAKKSTGGGKRLVRTSKRPTVKRKAPAKTKAARPQKDSLTPAPEALAMARAIAGVAADKKAENVVVIDTRARASSVGYDYVVLATGESDRQLSAIHEGVEQLFKPQGKFAASVEASADWVCVNYDVGVVAHFFTPDKRDMMDLEGLWKDAPRVAL